MSKHFKPQCLPRVRAANRRLLTVFGVTVLRCTLDDGTPFTSPVRCVDGRVVWTDDAVVKPLKRK